MQFIDVLRRIWRQKRAKALTFGQFLYILLTRILEAKIPISVDCVIFGFDDKELKVLLIKRSQPPFANYWALPGDRLRINEHLREAAYNVLSRLTGLRDIYLEQLSAFGNMDRHPSDRVVTIAYYALVNISENEPKAASFASRAEWIPLSQIKDLAYDHNRILDKALRRLRRRFRGKPVGFELLPEKFTLSQLRRLYESALDQPLDKRNFRRKMLKMDFLIPLEEKQKDVAHKAARFYRFNRDRYEELSALGEGEAFEF